MIYIFRIQSYTLGVCLPCSFLSNRSPSDSWGPLDFYGKHPQNNKQSYIGPARTHSTQSTTQSTAKRSTTGDTESDLPAIGPEKGKRWFSLCRAPNRISKGQIECQKRCQKIISRGYARRKVRIHARRNIRIYARSQAEGHKIFQKGRKFDISWWGLLEAKEFVVAAMCFLWMLRWPMT